MSISTLAKDTWKRFGAWYGVDAIQRKFGDLKPPADWCTAIDRIGADKLDLVLAQVKTKYPAFVPTLPEFERMAEPVLARAATAPHRPSTQYLLTCYALKHCSLARDQLWRPWTYLYRGDPRVGSTNFEITGVAIPASEHQPAVRLMVAEIDLDQLWGDEQAERSAIERKHREHVVDTNTALTPMPQPSTEELPW